MNLPQTNLCKYCGKKPKIVAAAGEVYYAQCRCGKWSPYEFCAASPRGAVNNWNTYNTKKDVSCQ